MDLYERIAELGSMGYHCSQMMMIMTLETIGEENPQLVKALGGLGGGIGYCGDTCGCLTGGACAIGYFLGNLAPEEKEDVQINPLFTYTFFSRKYLHTYRTDAFRFTNCNQTSIIPRSVSISITFMYVSAMSAGHLSMITPQSRCVISLQ